MGVQISELVTSEKIDLKVLQGRKIAIDAFNSLYQFLAIIRQFDGTPLMDSTGAITSQYSGLFYRTIKLVEAGIKPVYVFDGEPPELKFKTIQERRQTREEAEKKWKAAQKKGDMEAARKYAQASMKLTSEMIEGSKELLDAMGIPWVQAPSEGEAQAAYMCQKEDVYSAASQDFDSLLFGSKSLIRNLTITGRRKLPGKQIYVDVVPEYLVLENILQELGIDRKQLIWIGILVGTDFNDKVPGVGPKTALKLVKAHDSFEGILSAIDKKVDFDYKEIEDLFFNIKKTDDYKLKWKNPDSDKVKKFLCEKHDFSEDRVNNALKTMETGIETKQSQGRLDAFFN